MPTAENAPETEPIGEDLARAVLRDNVFRQGFPEGRIPPLNLPEVAPLVASSRKARMRDDNRPPSPNKVRFDPTINLGHVLTFAGFVVTGFLAYSLLEKRVSIVEVQQVRATMDDATQKAELKEVTTELKRDIKDVQRAVNDLAQSIRSNRSEDRADRR